MDIPSPVTGASVTGLTSPTYTLTSMNPKDLSSKQWYVSALGGTQTGVTVHSIGQPFTITTSNPTTIKLAPATSVVSVMSGFQANWPKNTTKIIGRKSVNVSSTATAVCNGYLTIDVPAGSPEEDLVELKALLSLMVGAAVSNLDALIESIRTGQ